MQTFIHSHAQFEDDTLGNIQPVKVMVEDATKTANYYATPPTCVDSVEKRHKAYMRWR